MSGSTRRCACCASPGEAVGIESFTLEVCTMKPKTLILMVVAVVCGLGASYMTSRLLAERDDKPADQPAMTKVKVLVAKKDLAMHTALKHLKARVESQ